MRHLGKSWLVGSAFSFLLVPGSWAGDQAAPDPSTPVQGAAPASTGAESPMPGTATALRLTAPTTSQQPIGTGVPDSSGARLHVGDEPNLMPQLRQQGGPEPQPARLLLSGPDRPQTIETPRRLAAPEPPSVPAIRPEGGQLTSQARPLEDEAPGLVPGVSSAVEARPVSRVRSTLLAPQLRVEIEGPDRVLAGEETRYQLSVSNLGESSADYVTLDVAVGDNARVTKASTRPEILDDVLRFTVDPLQPGEEQTLTLAVVARQSGPIELATRLSLSSQSTWRLAADPLAVDLVVTGPKSAKRGDDLSYQVEIQNSTPDRIDDLELWIETPEGMRMASGQADPIALGRLEGRDSKRLLIDFLVTEDGELPLRFELRRGGQTLAKRELNLNVETSEFSLALSGPTSVSLRQAETFQIEAANLSLADSGQVAVRLKIPQDIEIIALDREADFDATNRLLTWNLSKVEASQRVVLKLKAQALRSGTHTFWVQALSGTTEITRQKVAVRASQTRLQTTR